MKHQITCCLLLVATLGAADTNAQQSGQTVFRKHCSWCHAPGLNNPGTLQLSLTRGAENAVLEERNNLVPAYVKTIVRQGLNGMPPFKPTIVTEQELETLASYLADKE